jgi:hypothetical protein
VLPGDQRQRSVHGRRSLLGVVHDDVGDLRALRQPGSDLLPGEHLHDQLLLWRSVHRRGLRLLRWQRLGRRELRHLHVWALCLRQGRRALLSAWHLAR